jgi:hypothetical protein
MLGATDPARHTDSLELRQRRLEQRLCARAITGVIAADVHQRLVVIDNRAQWSSFLLVEHLASVREPFGGIPISLLQRAQLRQR